MLHLRPLPTSHWPFAHRLMRLRSFPGTPNCFTEAQLAFKQHALYGLYDEIPLPQVVLILGENNGTCAFIDAICQHHMQGKWLSRRVIRQIRRLCFTELGLSYLWTQVHASSTQALCLRLGFELCGSHAPSLLTLRKETILNKKGFTSHGKTLPT